MNDTHELVFELDEQDQITSRIETKAGPAKAPTPAPACIAKVMLDEFSARHPGIWKDVDKMRNQIARIQAVPSWCFMPEDGWNNLIVSMLANGDMDGFLPLIMMDGPAILRSGQMASEAAFFGTWRITQGDYRFDPTLFAELVATPVTGPIPTDMLKRLPEWAVYVETPGMIHPSGLPLVGFGARLCTHAIGDFLCIQIFAAQPNGDIIRGSHTVMLNGLTVEESLDLVERETEKNLRSIGLAAQGPAQDSVVWNKFFSGVISLLLWLCSEEPEIGNGRPVRPTQVRTKKGLRHFPADKPTVWNVGVRTGSALAGAKAVPRARGEPGDGTHASPRGHVRRAHWHSYLTGRKGNPTRIRHWLSPTLVNIRRGENLPVVIHPVKN